MRRILVLSNAALILALSTAMGLKLFQQVKRADSINQKEIAFHALTKAEEHDLQKLLPQTVRWIATWWQPTQCLSNGDLEEYDLAKIYKQYQSQELEFGLDIGKTSVIAYSDLLKIYVRFKRLHQIGLGVRDFQVYCGTAYDQLRLTLTATERGMSPILEEARKQGDVERIEAMELYVSKQPTPVQYEIWSQESRKCFLPPLSQYWTGEEDSQGNQKDELYKSILDEIRKQAKLSCAPKRNITVTIPDFRVGDPAIYVLMEGPGYDGLPYIEWISFDRDLSSGDFEANHMKSLALPDETEPLIPLIIRKQLTRIKIKCP